jgi:hypothetical protein
MTMPEKIWASSRPQDVGDRWTPNYCYDDQTGYTLTSIMDTRISELEAEVERLRGSLALIAARPLGGVLEDRLKKQIDYSIDLQRIIESLCNGRKIVEPKTTARHHYDMAMEYRQALARAWNTRASMSAPEPAKEGE